MKRDVGELEKIRIELSEPDNTPSWFVRRLRFEDQDTGDEFDVIVDDWINVNDEDDGVREFPIEWPGVTPNPRESMSFNARTLYMYTLETVACLQCASTV